MKLFIMCFCFHCVKMLTIIVYDQVNTLNHEVIYHVFLFSVCQDADGNCVKPGENFESLSYNGNRRSCYCKTNGRRVSAVCKSSNYG